jgi:periplasmic divalent cation tolerance protein
MAYGGESLKKLYALAMHHVCVALCTAPNPSQAESLAQALLASRLAACVSLLPGMHSLYWWQGQVESANEVLLIIKTTVDQVEALKASITEHHPYDTPELLVLPVSDGLERYLAWVQKETRPSLLKAGL